MTLLLFALEGVLLEIDTICKYTSLKTQDEKRKQKSIPI
jgi:hypothetical protein